MIARPKIRGTDPQTDDSADQCLALARLNAADAERMRPVVALWVAIGQTLRGDYASMANYLADRLAALPAARVDLRNAALAELSAHFAGSKRDRARDMARALRRYEGGRWRKDRINGSSELIYGEVDRSLFNVLSNSDSRGAPGFETIRKVLAQQELAWVEAKRLTLTHDRVHTLPDTNESRSRTLLVEIKSPGEAEVLAAIARRPESAKVLADERARQIAARRNLIAALADLDSGAEAEYRQNEKSVASAIAEHRKAVEALRAADARLFAATGAKAAALHARASRRHTIERELIDGADLKAISAFRSKLLDEMTALQRNSVIVTMDLTERNKVTGAAVRRTLSNTASIAKRLAAVRDALEAIDRLKLEPDQSNLANLFSEIWASLPSIEEFPAAKEGLA